MTKREVVNKYLSKLILIMKDPITAVRYCEPYSKGLLMGHLIDNMPDNKISGLWNIVRSAKYKENPTPLLKEMEEELKKTTD